MASFPRDRGARRIPETYVADKDDFGSNGMKRLLREAMAVGADAYCRETSVAVETAKAFMTKRQGSVAAATATPPDSRP